MRPAQTLLLGLTLATAGCAHRFVECGDTLTCRAMAAERDRQFALAVANEPTVVRLEVEPISRLALLDRQRQLVYLLDPGLVAVELRTGKQRWRAPGVAGDSLWRVGRLLAVSTQVTALPQRAAFVDLEAPTAPVSCTLTLGAPAVAEEVELHLFDRAGQPYAWWSSHYWYSGGTPPDEAHKARTVAAEACGVLKIDPRTCAASPQPLEDFVWDPPEGRRQQPGEPGYCQFLSPWMDLPAVAASAPQSSAASVLISPVSAGPTLRVITSVAAPDGCVEVTHLTLEARDEAATVLWSHPLQDLRVNSCKPP